jgi:hypothetical protein
MIRAALITLALTAPAPASAATVTDLTMTLIDGRPAFRPADGLDCWTAKFGGVVTDCVEIDGQEVQLPAPVPLFRQIGMTDREVLAAVFNGHDVPPAPVPLPAGGALLLAALLMMTALRGGRRV